MTNKPPDISVEGRLPRRQRDVLDGLKAGYSEKHIAEELGISPHTVHVHVKALYRRFGVRSRGELLSLWVRGK
jgi:DNA-binding NarL/FixJ family response regulator